MFYIRTMLHFLEIKNKILEVNNLEELEFIRTDLFGKSGSIIKALKELKNLSEENKKIEGKKINDLKNDILDEIQKKSDEINCILKKEKLEKERIDITIPSTAINHGCMHPISRTTKQILDFFSIYGFENFSDQEIENEFYNFDSLNIPKFHPARAMQDTFYIEDSDMLLRTHTSNVQNKVLKTTKPPIKIASSGRVYRNDSADSTHNPTFNQVEIIAVDEKLTIEHLKSLLFDFLKYFFEKDDIKIRFRPSFFPFTEPSAEVDIAYKKIDGQIVFGEGDCWMEVLGSGMIHPNVLKMGGIDTNKYNGFAAGIGVERFLMLKEGINDIRNLYENNVFWLQQYEKL